MYVSTADTKLAHRLGHRPPAKWNDFSLQVKQGRVLKGCSQVRQAGKQQRTGALAQKAKQNKNRAEDSKQKGNEVRISAGQTMSKFCL